MPNESPNNYLFLNRDGRWPHFDRFGLEIVGDGTLQLFSLPRLATPLSDAVKNALEPEGPAGIAIDRSGNLYFTQPDSNTLEVIQGCDSSLAPFPCVSGGTSGAPAELNAPRGLLIPPNRSVLFVADSGNNRIQIFDLNTHQLLEIWGSSASGASSQPGSFDTPWTMAADESGNIYVVDYGNQRLQKFNFLGDVIPSFAQNVAASGELQQPVDVAVRTVDGKAQVLIADGSTAQILVFDDAGNPLLDSSGNATVISDPHLTNPMGLAVAGDALYVGDNSARSIFRFQLGDEPAFVGKAIGYNGPVAALFLGRKKNLWVHPGDSLAPVSLSTDTGYGTLGATWSHHPISVERPVQWHRLQALLAPLDQN